MATSVDFERMGGREVLVSINKLFYDKVYAHPWLKLYFEQIPQEHIENQQVDFMQKVLGGSNVYAGKTPPSAHMHIFVDEELFEVRQKLLSEALNESGACGELVDKWLSLDQSFKKIIVKASLDECRQRYSTEPIQYFEKP